MDFEAVSTLLDFATRKEISTVNSFFSPDKVTVRTFATSTPTTPAAAPRPEHPPRIASRKILPVDTPRPRPLHRTSAALGAPPKDGGDESSEEGLELPDIPDTPQSPATSDITVHRLVYFFCVKDFFCFYDVYIFLYVTYDIFYFFSTVSSPQLIPFDSKEKGLSQQPLHQRATKASTKFVFPLSGGKGSPAPRCCVDVSYAMRMGAITPSSVDNVGTPTVVVLVSGTTCVPGTTLDAPCAGPGTLKEKIPWQVQDHL